MNKPLIKFKKLNILSRLKLKTAVPYGGWKKILHDPASQEQQQELQTSPHPSISMLARGPEVMQDFYHSRTCSLLNVRGLGEPGLSAKIMQDF